MTSGTYNFASVQINDAILKINIYLNKLSSLQQSIVREDQQKCKKIVRLCLQNFLKYNQNEDYSRPIYQMIKSLMINKRSYYMLYLFDLFIKNSKYFIKNAKRQLQSTFKLIWEKVWTEYNNQEKIQNLKIMTRCWGYIYGEKIQENVRKWLQTKYNIRKIQLLPQNQKQLKEIYGQKKDYASQKERNLKKDQRLNELLMSSLGETIKNDKSQLGYSNKKITSNPQVSKKILSGVNKSLLQALELD